MKKKLTKTLFVTMALCFAVSTASYAATTGAQMRIGMGQSYDESDLVPTPRFTYTDQAAVLLTFNGRSADCGVVILGKDNATKISGTLSLQKKSSTGSYSKVKSWTVSESSSELIYTDNYTVTESGDYRLNFSGKVYSGSAYENINVSVSDTCD